MTEKNNGMAQWVIVGLALLVVAFNSGITFNHIHELAVTVEKVARNVKELSEEISVIKTNVAGIKGLIEGRNLRNDVDYIGKNLYNIRALVGEHNESKIVINKKESYLDKLVKQ